MTKNLGEYVRAAEPPKLPRPLRIVVADDDRDAMLMLITVLRHEGHEAWGFQRGWDAVHSVRNLRPDAVLLDLAMPDLGGWQAAKEITQRYAPYKPLLVAITGYYMKGSDRLLSEISGFDHHLTKPYEMTDVLRLLAPLQFQEPPAYS